MESSSENSFAWTDTSSDSFNSESMAEELNNDYSKKKKKKKSFIETLANNDSGDRQPKMDIKEENKMIKLEPESDIDLTKKKKKIKHTEMNGNQNDLQNSISYDETYLNMKVKQEETCASYSTKHKLKKHKQRLSIDSIISTNLKSTENDSDNKINDVNFKLKQNTEGDTEINKSKKKKNKSKRKYDSEDHNPEIEDKMDIEESVVNMMENETLSRSSKMNHADSSIGDNNTLQDESEHSGYDEISAIKCDDDHSHHAISFTNQSIDEDNSEMNRNESLNIKTISSQHKLAKNSITMKDTNKKSEATEHRTQRISDRIRFEDDDDTNIESSQSANETDYENSKKSPKLKQFVIRNPNFKQISQKFNNKVSLTLDDDIWILKCPKEIEIRDFNNTHLNIHGKCKFKVGGQTYDVSAEEERSDTVSVLTSEHSKYKIRNFPLSGVIHLRKRIPKAHFRDDNIMVNNQTNFIPLPETKCRHPLFGSNYKKALKIPAAVAERLNVQDNEESYMNIEKRKNKKNKKDRKQVHSEYTLKSESLMEVSEKKNRKRKVVNDEGPIPKKLKRIKHDPESAEAWESEKAIEKNLFNF